MICMESYCLGQLTGLLCVNCALSLGQVLSSFISDNDQIRIYEPTGLGSFTGKFESNLKIVAAYFGRCQTNSS